ncbi:MAG: 2-hydroxychromene-2-carboxylate isomerase [Ghiorsea sp.]|nr:2-hydroxychromene-2-carboxylate isomerase [Ghiorsea sp.]MDQ7058662.1 2-hydroxychromene-2-carboxylate isomerase [Ghiorsea sp.]
MKKIDFYFDFISPYTYLAVTQMNKFEAEHDVKINWVAVNLPKLIKLSGNTPPASIKNKALYSLRDLKRWADYLEVPFKMIRPGTFDSRPAMYIAMVLEGEDRALFCKAVFEAIWSGNVNTREQTWLDDIFTQKQLPETWKTLAHNQSKQQLDENTQQALKAGAFGVPTFVLHGETRPQIFFGVDRMDFLARACSLV